MTVWRDVQEAIYQRFMAGWVDGQGAPLSPVQLDDETFDPPDDLWVKVITQRRPGGPGTLGRPGNRKMDRRGSVYLLLRLPPGNGVGRLSDLSEKAAGIFEGCRMAPHDIRFAEVEPLGDAGEVDKGRWRGVTVEGRFDYEQII